MKKTHHIFEETQREAIINRPHNLFGSIKTITKERFCIKDDSIEFRESSIVPALLKIFMEAVDNPIDVAIKYNLDIKIDIEVTEDEIIIKDNGPGIPNIKDEVGEYLVFKAFCKYNTSSNYKEFKNQGQKGVNGIGIKGSNTLSTFFKVTNDDAKTKVTIESTENNLHHKIKEAKSSGKSGVEISFKPDFKIIEGKEGKISEEHISRMREYVLMQALTYPNISLTFNKKKLNYTGKKFVSLFNKVNVLEETNDYFLAITSNEFDDFKQVSYVNGLETSKGGTHVEYLMVNLVNPIRVKLLKKYKTIKPADIRNKLQLILVAKNVKDIDWDGQTKESITTPNKYWSEYFKDIEFEKLASKILKTPEIIDPITEVYKIKEELKKRQDLKSLNKTVKKIKSEKYLPSIGKKKYLALVEGESAFGGLSPVLGRKEIGYYILKGKPLNAYSADQSKFTSNKELSELYKIIQNENYEYIIYATDQDLDGMHIRGLLTGFFLKYLPELKGRIGMLQTPVIGVKKNNKLVRWYYNIEDEVKTNSGETSKYYKGLGSHKEADLKEIVTKDGLEKMIDILEFDDDKIIDDWLGDNAEKRKDYILANDFSIAKL